MNTTSLQNAIARLTRLYPLYSGAASFANHSALRRLTGDKGIAWAPTFGGEVKADLSDFVGRAAFFVGDLDPKLTWVAKRMLRPGDTAFDVGANIGIMALLFARLVGKTGTVHAFEPNPEVGASLGSAVSRAKCSNIVLNDMAIGSKDATLTLRVPRGNRGSGSLVRGDEWRGAETHQVQVTTLDKYVAQNGIETIDLLKIDIEGFEIDLFRGAPNVLKNICPRAIVFEDNAREGETSPVIEFLLSSDYGLLSLPKAKFRMRAKIYDTKLGGHDFVAAKRGRQFDELCKRLA